MQRRTLLGTLAALAWPQRSTASNPADLLRSGGCAVLLRHAVTVPGIGDPENFRLGQCQTQRNLSDAGREQARRIGAWFTQRGLKPLNVLSSEWCRCQDTATLGFGQHRVWPALNSTFGDRLQQADASPLLRDALGRIPVGQFEVWVTHQVNITALSGEVPAMGEGFILDRQSRLTTRLRFD